MMQQESEDLRKKIEKDQKDLKKKSDDFNK